MLKVYSLSAFLFNFVPTSIQAGSGVINPVLNACPIVYSSSVSFAIAKKS